MKRPYKRKLTLWFKGDIKPTRVGVYQVSACGSKHTRGAGVLYCYWNGQSWRLMCRTPEAANDVRSTRYSNDMQNRAWRGRTEP